MKSNSFLKNNWFFFSMILGIVAGIIVGFAWPNAGVLEPLGTLFINMMFCVVVPMVFFSISSSIANMKSAKRAGKLMGTTVITFMCTTIIASVIMYVLVRFIPVYTGEPAFEPGASEPMTVGAMIVGFFTKPDFPELWSRRSILQLIIAGIFFGFGVQMCGGPQTKVAGLLEEITNVLMKVIKLISYYAPIGFFGFFAALVAAHGADFVSSYARAIILYYVVAFAYMFLIFPLYARFGGGKGAVKVMFQHLFRPAAVAFGTCSSVATIPTNMEVSEDTGISKDVTDIVLPMGATMNMDGSGMSAIIKVHCHHRGHRLLCCHVRYSRRRRHRRAGALLPVLPRAARGRLPDRAGHRRSGRSPRNHGQRRRRLCGLLHCLPLQRRQGLAPEGHGKEEQVRYIKRNQRGRMAALFY